MNDDVPPPSVEPIGVVRSPFRELAEAPRQPAAAADAKGVIELYPGRGFEDALVDLDAFTHLWVLFWFDRSEGWRPKVRPPRDDRKRGLFATRAPHRPNPIGLSVLSLERVDGLEVHVRGVDAVDGTPVLDLKPYVAYTDAIPDAGHGWLEEADPRPAWAVALGPLAAEQLQWLEREHGVALEGRLREALSLGPRPHAYRRIRATGSGRYRIAVKEWRASFRVDGRTIHVERIDSGYRPRELWAGTDPALDAHRGLVRRFG